MTTIHSANDVTEQVLEDAAEVYESWFASAERVDWEDFIDRLAKDGFTKYSDDRYDVESYDSPAIRKIQRHIRELRSQG